jgi:hypothetical protein
MNRAKRMIVALLMVAVCLGTASAERRINKKMKMTVTVEEDGNCSQGISVSGNSLGGRQLCADYPQGVGKHFQKYMGSIVEVEAQWNFEGDPKTDAPIALGKVYKIGRDKVNDPCALGKIGFLAGMTMVANGADPGATVASLTPGCENTDGTGDE